MVWEFGAGVESSSFLQVWSLSAFASTAVWGLLQLELFLGFAFWDHLGSGQGSGFRGAVVSRSLGFGI